VRPIPVAFHLGPFTFHTYGLGLAVTALVAMWWLERRLRSCALPAHRVPRWCASILLASLVGARLAHVATNWPEYHHHLGEIVALWHGGLSSYGGLAVGVPVALWRAPKWWPGTSRLVVADVVTPVLVGSWGIGRLLGPQLMFAGGGHLTTAWFGMHYAGQVGARVPVPLIQGAEDLLIAALSVRLSRRASLPAGCVTALAMAAWGCCRALDEQWLLGGGTNLGSLLVIGSSIIVVLGGAVVLLASLRRAKLRR
jgi:phosphatidylglycerol:prolipoprotein diacylglycerol transferase